MNGAEQELSTWLYKLGGGKSEGSQWNRRYFLLHGSVLQYFKSEGALHRPNGAVLVEQCTVSAREESAAADGSLRVFLSYWGNPDPGFNSTTRDVTVVIRHDAGAAPASGLAWALALTPGAAAGTGASARVPVPMPRNDGVSKKLAHTRASGWAFRWT